MLSSRELLRKTTASTSRASLPIILDLLAMAQKISIPQVLSQVKQPWSPKLVATLNDAYEIKVVKIAGELVWHSHVDTDELFYVLNGNLTTQLENAQDVELEKGDMFVVPRGLRHKPVCNRAEIMLMEMKGVINTGDAEVSDLTNAVVDVRKV